MPKESIIKSGKYCFFCGVTCQLERHHVFMAFNRNKAEEDGLWVYLCPECHRGTNGVHGKNGHEKDIALKKAGQYAYMKVYGATVEGFRNRYHKSYLGDDDH